MKGNDRCKGCVRETTAQLSDVCKTCSRLYDDSYEARQTPRTVALDVIQNGEWWNYLPDEMPDDVKTIS